MSQSATRGDSVLYLLDAGVLIEAHRDYYPIDRVREFWDWLLRNAEAGRIKVPREVYEEVAIGNRDGDLLVPWIKSDDVKEALILADDAEPSRVARVVEEGYAPDLTDDQLESIGCDPFLISYALGCDGGRCVVTTEVSKPTSTRHNRRIPDVCRDLGIPCCHTYELVRRLDFRTG